ncbi:MAG TPA: GNAT family N-acetyltransferase [Actinomycetota bacterium]|nr:GNAT family N-acetyltransferase [Actinomycetota bacterium]
MADHTTTGPIVREAQPEDRDDVARTFAVLDADLPPGDPRLAAAAEDFERHGGVTLVAELDGRVIGALSYFIRRFGPGDAGPSLWIDSLAVDDRYRRRGAGRALMDETLRRARAAGCTTLIVHTHEEMAAALALYTSVGFERHGLYLHATLA